MDLPVGISTLQRTDRWIGAPLCAILTLFRIIFESAGPPGPRQVRRILFVKFAEQGSTVLAYPAIRRAIEMVGREKRLLRRIRRQSIHSRRDGNHSRGKCDNDRNAEPFRARAWCAAGSASDPVKQHRR